MDVLWSDASIEAVTIEYDAVTLLIREERGHVRSVRCEGHIACSIVGVWDEAIIERADIHDTHRDIDAAWNRITQRLGNAPPDTGSVERNRRRFRCLVVRLIDGCELSIVASKFHLAEKVECPRCGQDWLDWVQIPAVERTAIACPECDALWPDEAALTTSPAAFEDLGTYLKQHGVKLTRGVTKVIGRVTRPSRR